MVNGKVAIKSYKQYKATKEKLNNSDTQNL